MEICFVQEQKNNKTSNSSEYMRSVLVWLKNILYCGTNCEILIEIKTKKIKIKVYAFLLRVHSAMLEQGSGRNSSRGF